MAENEDDDKDLRIVGDDANDGGETVVVDEDAAKKAAAAAATGDERLAQDDEDDDAAATEAIREQRRAERRAKKVREHQARDRNRRELDLLRARNEVLERRQSELDARLRTNEATQADAHLARIDSQIRQADAIIEDGVNNQKGAAVTEATNIKNDLLDERRKYLAKKDSLAEEARSSQDTQQREVQQQQQQRQEVDPELLAHANKWKAAHPWYKPDTSDDDSAIVAAIDARLVSDGFDPTTAEYWQELTTRTKRVLPQRYASNGNGNGNGERRGPQMANGNRERALKPGEVYVSAERKQALIDAGAWEDPKLRVKYLKAYAQYDADAANKANA